MKHILAILTIALFLFSCKNEASQKTTEETPASYAPPPPGTILLADSIRIPDNLNERYFIVKLIANEYTGKGTYDVRIFYGHNDASTQITFPHGGTEPILPKMKKGNEPLSYIIGFYYGEEDTTFYEYYEVKGAEGKIETNYLSAYSFQ